MACSASRNFGPVVVWSSGSTTNWVFHPVAEPEPSADVPTTMRPNLGLAQSSGNAKIRLALRMSNDGLTFDTPVAIGSLVAAAESSVFGTTYSDLASNLVSKRLVQFGIQCQNASGSNIELCSASAQLDLRNA
jgi:hypothetical protein